MFGQPSGEGRPQIRTRWLQLSPPEPINCCPNSALQHIELIIGELDYWTRLGGRSSGQAWRAGQRVAPATWWPSFASEARLLGASRTTGRGERRRRLAAAVSLEFAARQFQNQVVGRSSAKLAVRSSAVCGVQSEKLRQAARQQAAGNDNWRALGPVCRPAVQPGRSRRTGGGGGNNYRLSRNDFPTLWAAGAKELLNEAVRALQPAACVHLAASTFHLSTLRPRPALSCVHSQAERVCVCNERPVVCWRRARAGGSSNQADASVSLSAQFGLSVRCSLAQAVHCTLHIAVHCRVQSAHCSVQRIQ